MMRTLLTSAALLALFAVAGTGMVALTHEATRERIAENERRALLEYLNALVPKGRYDNDPYADTVRLCDPEYLGSEEPVTVYRARKGGEPVAALFAAVAPDGYNGTIRMLIGIYRDGTLAGARVLGHRETPGLGDAIEAERSAWIHQFAGRSLHDPEEAKWKVRKDGGLFDQFTGATITPRAVVKAIYNTQVYFRGHKEEVFAVEREEEPGSIRGGSAAKSASIRTE